jgi:hypothetical protein
VASVEYRKLDWESSAKVVRAAQRVPRVDGQWIWIDRLVKFTNPVTTLGFPSKPEGLGADATITDIYIYMGDPWPPDVLNGKYGIWQRFPCVGGVERGAAQSYTMEFMDFLNSRAGTFTPDKEKHSTPRSDDLRRTRFDALEL